MSDIDTRLRETLRTVAEQTTSMGRVEQVVQSQPRPRRRVESAVAGFTLALLLIGAPALIGLFNQNEVGTTTETLAPPDHVSTVPTDEPTTVPGKLLGAPKPVTEPGWVLDPSWFTVEAGDYESLPRNPGGEPHLRADTIWCLFADGSSTEGDATPDRPDGEITEETLYAACEERRNGGPAVMPETMTYCRGVVDLKHMADSGEKVIVGGSFDGPKPGFVVALGWESDCVSEKVGTNPPVTLDTDLDLERINHLRQVEIAVYAASIQNCFTYDQAHAVAAETRRILGDDWVHAHNARQWEGAEDCYRLWIQPNVSLIWVSGH